jgi:hypothetical protein
VFTLTSPGLIGAVTEQPADGCAATRAAGVVVAEVAVVVDGATADLDELLEHAASATVAATTSVQPRGR